MSGRFEPSVYQQILEDEFAELPARLRELHLPDSDTNWAGNARVTRGSSVLTPLICWIFRFPPATESTPVQVRFSVKDSVEIWERNFGGAKFRSSQRVGMGKWRGLLEERFGPFRFSLKLNVLSEKMTLTPVFWSFGPIPFPMWACPNGDSFECERNGVFWFHVEINLPLVGKVVGYEGYLKPMKT